MRIHLRYFAAAEAALGRPDDDLDLADGVTIQSVLNQLAPAEPAMASLTPSAQSRSAQSRSAQSPSAQVLGRCSFLVNGVATADRDRRLRDGDTIDVLPPFAGG